MMEMLTVPLFYVIHLDNKVNKTAVNVANQGK